MTGSTLASTDAQATVYLARAHRKAPLPPAAAAGPGRTKLPHTLVRRWIDIGTTNQAELARLCTSEATTTQLRSVPRAIF